MANRGGFCWTALSCPPELVMDSSVPGQVCSSAASWFWCWALLVEWLLLGHLCTLQSTGEGFRHTVLCLPEHTAHNEVSGWCPSLGHCYPPKQTPRKSIHLFTFSVIYSIIRTLKRKTTPFTTAKKWNQPSVYQLINSWSMVLTHDGIIRNYKKKLNSVICDNMNGTRDH